MNPLEMLIQAMSRKTGETALGKGTQQDATPGARAYQLYSAEAQSLGQTPMTAQQWLQSQQQPVKAGLLR